MKFNKTTREREKKINSKEKVKLKRRARSKKNSKSQFYSNGQLMLVFLNKPTLLRFTFQI